MSQREEGQQGMRNLGSGSRTGLHLVTGSVEARSNIARELLGNRDSGKKEETKSQIESAQSIDGRGRNSLPLRGKPTGNFCWQDNELSTVFQPIIGSAPCALYCHLTRIAYGPTVRYTLRRLANATGRSPTSAYRDLLVLEWIGMVRIRFGSGNRESECSLVDLKELARSLGAVYHPRAASYVLEPAAAELLKMRLAEDRKVHKLVPVTLETQHS